MFNFKIGADPEFLFFHQNRMAPADRSLRAVFGKKSTDYPLMDAGGYKIGEHGNLGWDGHSSTGEIRPTPSKDPAEVARNIGEIVKAATKEMPYLTMTTLSIGSAIGGHVHLELPKTGPLAPGAVAVMDRSADSLGRMFATFISPILASEHRISSAVRVMGSGYGKITDIRMNEFNGGRDKTVEVRGATAEWTCHPEVAVATLTYLGVVWNEILKRGPTAVARNPVMFKTLKQAESIQNLILSEYGPAQASILASIHAYVKTFDAYQDNKDAVDLVFNTQKISKMKESVGWNLTRGWSSPGEAKASKPTKRTFLSDKTTKENLKKIDLDALRGVIPTIAFNDDYNMGRLMDALSKRLTALGLELDNSYFFYGLKKGADDFLIAEASRGDSASERDLLYHSAPRNIPLDAVKDIAKRMTQRFGAGTSSSSKTARIDPLTGKNKNALNGKIITFGIPYDLREKGEIRPFLAKLWDIERGVTIPTKLTELPTRVLAKGATEGELDNVPAEILANLQDERTQNIPDGLIINPNES